MADVHGFVNVIMCVHLLVNGLLLHMTKLLRFDFSQRFWLYTFRLVNTCSMAKYSLQHSYFYQYNLRSAYGHTHPQQRQKRKGVFHCLSEFQFVLVKMEGVLAWDIRAGQFGAGAGHCWLSAHRCSFRSVLAEIHLLPVLSEPQSMFI